MVELVKEAILVAIRYGEYTVYVFKAVESSEYIMCTRLPNWQSPAININDRGFLQYQIVEAGDEYSPLGGNKVRYKYSNIYFINFVKRSEVNSNKELIL
jgi:hypothetical protein